MKIFICYDMKDTPHGGANQFLKALKKQFKKNDSYADNVPEADVVLYNSHHDIKTLIHEALHDIILRNNRHTIPEEKEHKIMELVYPSLISPQYRYFF